MKKQQKKYLALYKEWLESGRIDPIYPGNYNGMCGLFEHDELFKLLRPTSEDVDELVAENKCTAWWGSEMSSKESFSEKGWSSFTPLRQNIVLLMACMAGEL